MNSPNNNNNRSLRSPSPFFDEQDSDSNNQHQRDPASFGRHVTSALSLKAAIDQPTNAAEAQPKRIDHTYYDYSTYKVGDDFKKGKKAGSNFPAKLHQILSNPAFVHVISWMPHGRAWKIHNRDLLVNQVLPNYFAQTKYESFTRQLNGWGFKRLHQKGPDFKSFYHECFLRGLPQLTWLMKRVEPNQGRLLPDVDGEPNFYEIDKRYSLHHLPRSTADPVAQDPSNRAVTTMGTRKPFLQPSNASEPQARYYFHGTKARGHQYTCVTNHHLPSDRPNYHPRSYFDYDPNGNLYNQYAPQAQPQLPPSPQYYYLPISVKTTQHHQQPNSAYGDEVKHRKNRNHAHPNQHHVSPPYDCPYDVPHPRYDNSGIQLQHDQHAP